MAILMVPTCAFGVWGNAGRAGLEYDLCADPHRHADALLV